MDDDNHDHNNANVPLVSSSNSSSKDSIWWSKTTKESLALTSARRAGETSDSCVWGARLEDGWDMVGHDGENHGERCKMGPLPLTTFFGGYSHNL